MDCYQLSQILRDRSHEICELNECTEDKHNCDSYAFIDASGNLMDICISDYFQGSSDIYAVIPLPWYGNRQDLFHDVRAELFEANSCLEETDPKQYFRNLESIDRLEY